MKRKRYTKWSGADLLTLIAYWPVEGHRVADRLEAKHPRMAIRKRASELRL